MDNKNDKILKIMKDLQLCDDIIAEYEEFGILPYKRESLTYMAKAILKMLNIKQQTIFNEEFLLKIDKLYYELNKNNLL